MEALQTRLINLDAFLLGTDSGYEYPVDCSPGVWQLIDTAVQNDLHLNDYRGVISDLLHHSRSMRSPLQIAPNRHRFFAFIFGLYSNSNTFPLEIALYVPVQNQPRLLLLLPTE